MRPQAARARLGRRIYQPRRVRVGRPVRKVVALGVVQLRPAVLWDDHVMDVSSREAGGIDDGLCRDGRPFARRGILYVQLPSAATLTPQRLNALHPRVERHHAAGLLEQALEADH